jgi:23S rRNA (cytosine1962-C5)-methyltransferase
MGADGTWYGRGAYSPHSQITVRLWTFDPAEAVDASFFQARLRQAVAAREFLAAGSPAPGLRLVNAEADGLPGLIVDRYGEFLLCQFLAAGAEFWRQTIVEQLGAVAPNAGIYERSDVEVRCKEGLPERTGVLAGREPPELIEICEGNCRFLVDVRAGQKTGFYLDQRGNRAILAEYAAGRDVLNCFAFTGGFGVAALKAGARSVVNVELSAAALELAHRHIDLNGLDAARVENVQGDVFAVLRQYRDSRRTFDLVILDPPKFAASRHQLERAARGYKDINLLAFKLLRPGGVLFTFSCSGLVTAELFHKIVADAALDAHRDAQVLRWLTQGPDHPASLSFPQASYLKGLVCRAW